jgi:hypothetical protein
VPFFGPCNAEGAVAGALACLESNLGGAGYGSSGAVQEPWVGSQLGSTIPRSDSA